MNAITHTETQAIATALETAAPAQNLLLVPLSQLRPSRRNVRKTAGQSIDAFAASIARVGLLQNLTVMLASDGEHYEVVAGGRRLAALKLLAKKRHIPKDWGGALLAGAGCLRQHRQPDRERTCLLYTSRCV